MQIGVYALVRSAVDLGAVKLITAKFVKLHTSHS